MLPGDFTSDRAWRDSTCYIGRLFFSSWKKNSFIQAYSPIWDTHPCRNTLLQTHRVPICPLINQWQWQIWSPLFLSLLIASEPQPTLCKNKLTWHPVKWRLWNGNVCHTKVFRWKALCVCHLSLCKTLDDWLPLASWGALTFPCPSTKMDTFLLSRRSSKQHGHSMDHVVLCQ